MARASGVWTLGLALAAVTWLGCSAEPGVAKPEAPPAPAMPAGWEVTTDMSFPANEVRRVGRNLGGELVSLRNTVFEVNGKRVQLNIMEAADEAAANRIMLRLRDMKPADVVLKKGVVLYELVGADDAVAEMRAGRAHLEGGA